jgi:hypothetical protein
VLVAVSPPAPITLGPFPQITGHPPFCKHPLSPSTASECLVRNSSISACSTAS